MLKFRKEPQRLVLIYSGDYSGTHWIFRRFDAGEVVRLNQTFELRPNHLVRPRPADLNGDNEFDDVEFFVAALEGEYFHFDREVLNLENELYIHVDVPLEKRAFVAERNISVFSKIDSLSVEDIYVGGDSANSIPAEDFLSLIKGFPNSYELKKYAAARVGAVLTNYINLKEDSQKKYISYMSRKPSKRGADLVQDLAELEVHKYDRILAKLKDMLADEDSYTEKQWQKEILQVVLLLYPKYIHAFDEVPVRDTYNSKNRSIDFLLVDSAGNTDIIEIKKPFRQCIVTKRTYRDNYIPLRELSGTVMQVEKYIFYLNRWGKRGEDTLTKRYKDSLTPELSIKVTNPSGIIIMGREMGLTSDQKQDFEVIKRKYKNVIDIVTYDDLVNRLKIMLDHWKSCT